MEEYTIGGLPDLIPTWEQTPAILNISLECGDAYLEFVANPLDRTVTISSVATPDDDLAFDVEDFALITTLLIRQAQR